MQILGRIAVIVLAFGLAAPSAQRKPGDYPLGPDSLPQAGVPKGQLIGPRAFHSKVLAGTVRRYWIYVPAQYTAGRPANVLVFQDGQRATNPEGVLRVPQVLDNLIHKLTDQFNGVFWRDDSQVVELHVCKRFSADGRLGVEIEVAPL